MFRYFAIFFLLNQSRCLAAQQARIDSLRKALADTRTDTSKIVLLDLLSSAYRDNQKVDSCILARKQALVLNENNHYSLQLKCGQLAGIDYMLYETGNYVESLNYAAEHLPLAEKLKDTMLMGLAYLVIGHDYRELGYYRESLNHYFQARKIIKSFYDGRNKPEDNIYTFECIAQVYLKMNDLDSALFFNRHAFELAVKDSIGVCILLSTRIFGDICLAKGDYEGALHYYRQYMPDFVKYKEINRDLGFVLLNVAKIFQNKSQADSTLYYGKKALENAQKYNDFENIFQAGVLLSDYYREINDQQALYYLRAAWQARDSVINIDKSRQAQLFLFNEQVREKEMKQADLKEAAKTRLFIITAAIIISIISFLIWYRIRQLRLKHKMVLEQKEAEKLKVKYEKELLTLEAQALRAQMNPHFIYNCMNSIKALIQTDDKFRAVEYLTTFSKLMRTIFHNSDKRQISLYDEIETCKLYTQLESMRLNGKLQYDFYIDPNLDLKSVLVPALIVQPFIENAIWHGIVPRDGGAINISVTGNEETIICEVDDNGIGRESSKLNKPFSPVIHESKGVYLSRQRLNLEKTLNDTNAYIEIIDKYEDSLALGTMVRLSFNLF